MHWTRLEVSQDRKASTWTTHRATHRAQRNKPKDIVNPESFSLWEIN